MRDSYLVILTVVVILSVYTISNDTNFGITPAFELHTVHADLISPFKQYKFGVPINETQCAENLILLQRNDKPACVSHLTAQTLQNRGWNAIEYIPSDAPQLIQRLLEKYPGHFEDFSSTYSLHSFIKAYPQYFEESAFQWVLLAKINPLYYAGLSSARLPRLLGKILINQ